MLGLNVSLLSATWAQRSSVSRETPLSLEPCSRTSQSMETLHATRLYRLFSLLYHKNSVSQSRNHEQAPYVSSLYDTECFKGAFN